MLECARCQTKFLRSSAADWSAFNVEGKCFECFVSDSLGGIPVDTIIIGTRGHMFAKGCSERIAIAARNAQTRQWLVLTFAQHLLSFDQGVEFYEAVNYGDKKKVG